MIGIAEKKLEKAILSTLVYFDLWDFPLTAWEIYVYLYLPLDRDRKKISFFEIQESLQKSSYLKDRVGRKKGFYFLKQRGKIVEIRESRLLIARRKYQKALLFARIARFFPFVKMVAVCNTLAFSHSRFSSDLDFFVITSKARIWSARFFLIIFLSLLGWRPTKRRARDKICLSFWAAEDAPSLESLCVGQDDIYLKYWIASLVPVYDTGGVYSRFRRKNRWIKVSLPNTLFCSVHPIHRVKRLPRWRDGAGKICSFFWFDKMEKMVRFFQIRFMNDILKKQSQEKKGVILTQKILKFHIHDQRENIQKKYRALWKRVSKNEKISV